MTLLAQAAAACILAASPAEVRLDGLSCDEAGALVATVRDAQDRLERGEDLYFLLLSGAPASYPMNAVSPREAFLALPLDKVWSVSKPAGDNPLWVSHRLSVLPDGVGQRLWDVEVVLGSGGAIERVQMLYRPPSPF